MTLSDARTLVRNDIAQASASTSDFQDSELNGFINQGVRYLGALVNKPVKRTSFASSYDTAAYAIATVAPDLILPIKAYFGDPTIASDVRPIIIIPEEELAAMRPGWLDTTLQTQGRPQFLIRDGSNLVINPRPNATESASGKLIYLTYVYQPTDLASDSSSMDLPLVYHDLVAKFAVHLCYMGKLNNIQQGLAIKNEINTDAKKRESMIVKESLSPGFSWGSVIEPDDGMIIVMS